MKTSVLLLVCIGAIIALAAADGIPDSKHAALRTLEVWEASTWDDVAMRKGDLAASLLPLASMLLKMAGGATTTSAANAMAGNLGAGVGALASLAGLIGTGATGTTPVLAAWLGHALTGTVAATSLQVGWVGHATANLADSCVSAVYSLTRPSAEAASVLVGEGLRQIIGFLVVVVASTARNIWLGIPGVSFHVRII
jgi:hypothetical protein